MLLLPSHLHVLMALRGVSFSKQAAEMRCIDAKEAIPATLSSCLTCAWGWRDGLRLPLGTLQFVRACYEGIDVGGRAAARPGPLDCPLSWACCFFGALQAALLRRLILRRCG